MEHCLVLPSTLFSIVLSLSHSLMTRYDSSLLLYCFTLVLGAAFAQPRDSFLLFLLYRMIDRYPDSLRLCRL
jgi:hypothetical protein